LQKWNDDGLIEFLCLRQEGILVGVCGYGKSITEEYPNDGEIYSIYLSPDCIGKGYGHALFSEAEESLINKGYTELLVNTFAANTRALSFYANHGYSTVKEKIMRFGDSDYPYRILRKCHTG
jgi:ribosomal protein S18 acetylase RimI-like enzyme